MLGKKQDRWNDTVMKKKKNDFKNKKYAQWQEKMKKITGRYAMTSLTSNLLAYPSLPFLNGTFNYIFNASAATLANPMYFTIPVPSVPYALTFGFPTLTNTDSMYIQYGIAPTTIPATGTFTNSSGACDPAQLVNNNNYWRTVNLSTSSNGLTSSSGLIAFPAYQYFNYSNFTTICQAQTRIYVVSQQYNTNASSVSIPSSPSAPYYFYVAVFKSLNLSVTLNPTPVASFTNFYKDT